MISQNELIATKISVFIFQDVFGVVFSPTWQVMMGIWLIQFNSKRLRLQCNLGSVDCPRATGVFLCRPCFLVPGGIDCLASVAWRSTSAPPMAVV